MGWGGTFRLYENFVFWFQFNVSIIIIQIPLENKPGQKKSLKDTGGLEEINMLIQGSWVTLFKGSQSTASFEFPFTFYMLFIKL